MTTQGELLAAIRAQPEDDAPRLVYADWLLERGDARGELITLQCRAAGGTEPTAGEVLRAAELSAHVETWTGFRNAKLRRGFVETIDFFDPQRIDDLDALVEREPVQWLALRGADPERFAAAAAWGGLAKMRGVSIASSAPEVVLESARRLGGLGFLHYTRIAPLLAALPASVRALRLMGFDLGADTFRDVQAPLERLCLEACNLRGVHLADRVFGSVVAAGLHGLGLSHNPLGNEARLIGELAGTKLRELTLGSIGLDPSGLRALAATPLASRLVHLGLDAAEAPGAPPAPFVDPRKYGAERRQSPNPLRTPDIAAVRPQFPRLVHAA